MVNPFANLPTRWSGALGAPGHGHQPTGLALVVKSVLMRVVRRALHEYPLSYPEAPRPQRSGQCVKTQRMHMLLASERFLVSIECSVRLPRPLSIPHLFRARAKCLSMASKR